VLTAASTQAAGVTWASGASTTYRKITSKTVKTPRSKARPVNADHTGRYDLSDEQAGDVASLMVTGKTTLVARTLRPRSCRLGGTTILDTNRSGPGTDADSANRYGWEIEVTIQARTAATQ